MTISKTTSRFPKLSAFSALLKLRGRNLQTTDAQSRGNWRSFEPLGNSVAPFLAVFLNASEPHVLAADRIVRRSA